MLNRISILAAGAAIAALATTSAGAGTFASGNFGFSGDTSTTTDLNSTTAFTNSAPGDVITVSSVAPTGNDFAGVLAIGGTEALGATLDFGAGTGFNFSDPTGIGSFAETSVVLLNKTSSGSGSTENTVLSYEVFGNFTVGSDFTNPGTLLTADETFTLSQTGGAGKSINIGGTFNSPAVTLVPEPITLSLFGVGLAGLGFGARRRKAATKA